jgi:peptidyl-prolyl cis-trans isomerase SurA
MALSAIINNFKSPIFVIIFYIFTYSQGVAESIFSTALTVNNLVISNYDLNQRELLYKLLRKAGDIKLKARNDLINDRIKLQVINNEKIKLNKNQLKELFVKYANKIGLDELRLSEALNNSGVDHETLVAYLSVEKRWQKVIIKKFVPLIEVTPHEIERYHLHRKTAMDTKILLAEIALPLSKETSKRSKSIVDKIIARTFTINEFSKLAASISMSPTAKNGGVLEWLPLESLTQELRVKLLNLEVAELSSPIVMGTSLIVFQMRGVSTPKKEKTSILNLKDGDTYNVIKNKLYNQKAEFHANSFFGRLKAKAIIINK